MLMSHDQNAGIYGEEEKSINILGWDIRTKEATWNTQTYTYKDNIKNDLKERGWNGMVRIHLAPDRGV
jgi:hypothetical protein